MPEQGNAVLSYDIPMLVGSFNHPCAHRIRNNKILAFKGMFHGGLTLI